MGAERMGAERMGDARIGAMRERSGAKLRGDGRKCWGAGPGERISRCGVKLGRGESSRRGSARSKLRCG
jgi:hypothetical protein